MQLHQVCGPVLGSGRQSACCRPPLLTPVACKRPPLHAYTGSGSSGADPWAAGAPGPTPDPAAGDVPASTPQPAPTLWERVKNFFGQGKLEKEKLAALGMGAFASYGFISNATYCTCLTIAWIGFVKVTGTTPLVEGQWKPFLAYYAGLWTIQNFVRPLRFALAVALAPTFERIIAWIGDRTRLPKTGAFALLLVTLAVTTTACLVSAIALLGGFPDGIPFLSQPVVAAAK